MFRWIRNLLGGAPEPQPEPVTHPLRAGQVWRYFNRPGEDSSFLVITRVESYPKIGEVVHIRLDGLRIANPLHPSGVSEEIGHLPFAGDAVRRSVTVLIRDDEPPPEDDEGYRTWQKAFKKGEGGVFTIPVAEVVEGMEQALRQ